ncbi:MAG: hypothetical protein LBI60_02615 [Bacteroidales bacterium]|jgi:hypothetical protein|nr:hypothetical protein [Bacteroidales bacterium]
MTTKKEIFVGRGETGRMARLFLVTSQAVRNAIRGLSNSELSDRIREEALRSGGVLTPNKRMKKVIKKRIFIERGETSRLARLFIVSETTIGNAIRGQSDGELSDKIREEALRAGGVLLPNKRRVIKKEA